MGQNCPCFGFRRGKKLKTDGDNNVNEMKCRISVENGPQSPAPVPETSASEDVPETSASEDAPAVCKKKDRTFTFRELATATRNFRSENFIGRGGFGAVYKGKLKDTDQVVAVKKLDQTGFQGDREFLVEVLMLLLLDHPNLVNMIGYCAEGEQRLLVYEIMPLGSLEEHIHDHQRYQEPLDWDTRMMIATGAAKGLEYLHHEADPPVIYRDLKTDNILLGEGYHPKLSDFGLAKFGPSDDRSHVSTRVMGTHGYCAPEYALSGKLTMKSDIYSYGVVLLELITGRRALDEDRDREKRLVEWARPLLRNRNKYMQLADPRLGGQFSESTLKKALDVAVVCLQENPATRPSMKEVVPAMTYLASNKHDKKVDNKVYRNTSEDNSPAETTIMLNKGLEREQAVAEAKTWGESWRNDRVLNVK